MSKGFNVAFPFLIICFGCCQLSQCNEKMNFPNLALKLIQDEKIPMPIKKQILTATLYYVENEMEKYRNNPDLCPKNMPKELCQTPPTFYIWMKKLRDEMIATEINKSNLPKCRLFLSSNNFFL